MVCGGSNRVHVLHALGAASAIEPTANHLLFKTVHSSRPQAPPNPTTIKMLSPNPAAIAAAIVFLALACVPALARALDFVATPRLIRSGYFGIHQ